MVSNIFKYGRSILFTMNTRSFKKFMVMYKTTKSVLACIINDCVKYVTQIFK